VLLPRPESLWLRLPVAAKEEGGKSHNPYGLPKETNTRLGRPYNERERPPPSKKKSSKGRGPMDCNRSFDRERGRRRRKMDEPGPMRSNGRRDTEWKKKKTLFPRSRGKKEGDDLSLSGLAAQTVWTVSVELQTEQRVCSMAQGKN